MDMNLRKLREVGRKEEPGVLHTVHRSTKSGHNLVTEQQPVFSVATATNNQNTFFFFNSSVSQKSDVDLTG